MELSRMKMKLHDALASKTLTDDVNSSLQVRFVHTRGWAKCSPTFHLLSLYIVYIKLVATLT